MMNSSEIVDNLLKNAYLEKNHHLAKNIGLSDKSCFLFAYPDSVNVSMQVWHTKEAGLIHDGSNLNYGLDHPQMISGKATSTLYHLIYKLYIILCLFLIRQTDGP